MTDQITPAILYAAKSTADPNGSIPRQIEDTRGMADHEGWTVIGQPHSDEGKSAFSGNRGPGLEAAKLAAIEAAHEYGEAMLVVQHSDRLARGSGRKGEAQHLAALYFELQAEGVALRSVQDDDNLKDAIRAVLVGERNYEDSKRKSGAVTRGKDGQFQRGEKLGGPVNDGLKLRIERDASDRIVSRRYERDPERAPVIERLFDLSEEGHGDSTVMRKLNAEGHRTRHGKPWTRRTVQHTVLNAVYAGRIVRKSRGSKQKRVKLTEPEVVDATNVEALIEPARYDRIVAKRESRDRMKPEDRSKRGGRKTSRYALARLAICDRCGERMYARTSPYKRKDGTHRRAYICANYHAATDLCDQKPLDAEQIDKAVIAYLDELFVDFDTWKEQLSKVRTVQREQAEAALTRTADEVTTLDRQAAKVRADYVKKLDEGKEQGAQIAYDILEELTQKSEALAAAAKVQQRVIEEMDKPTEDSLLDAYNGLAKAVRGEGSGKDLLDLNERLQTHFDEFRLDQVDDDTVGVMPVLRKIAAPDVASAYAAWEEAGCPEPTDEEVAEWDRISRGQSFLADDGAIPADLPAGVPALIWATGREEIRPPARAFEVTGMEQNTHE